VPRFALVLTGAALFLAAADGRAGQPAPAGKIKVFILSGQSNMVGGGSAREVPAEMAAEDPNVLLWSRGEWTPLKPAGRVGPEISFGKEMAKAWPGRKIGIVKFAVGGTSVTQWDPDKKGSGKRAALYARLMGYVKAAKEKTPGGVEFVGLIWMQGERDSRDEKLAKAYTANLKKFVDRVRADTGAADLPFVLGRIRTPDSYKFRDVVRKAQTEVAGNIPNSAWADADGLEMKGDNLHYNTAGQIGLGQRFAKVYLELVADKAKAAK
jgi:hypothetical protein